MSTTTTLGGLQKADFQKTIDNKQVDLFILSNKNGLEMSVTNFGGKIVSLHVPDKNGKLIDVVLGHPNIAEYLTSQEPYFGAVCGRTGNRIAKGKFTLDGKEYHLAINNGPNNLHGGLKGFNAVVWDAKQTDEQTIELTYLSKDGEEGFPGNLTTKMTYHLSDSNAVEITYEAATDQATILNLTNHSYFNLSGAGDPYIGDHLLQINAETYLPTDNTAIPYVLNKKGNELEFCAKLESPKTGIVMNVYTTEPGVQLYTGNWMTGEFVAKNGQRYPERSALCLETQHFPDSINQPDFPSVVLRSGDTFHSQTIFKFL